MKIWQKLALAWGVTSSLLGVIGILTVRIDKQVQSETNEVVHGIVREAQAAGEMFVSIQLIQDFTEKFLVENENNIQKYINVEDYKKEIESKLNELERNVREAKQASITQKQILNLHKETSNENQIKLKTENEDLARLDDLEKQIQLYKQEWKTFWEIIARNGSQEEITASEEEIIDLMSESIVPLVSKYYEDSLEEIIESELITQSLTSENIKIIRNYAWFTLLLTLILFIYLYYSIYAPIALLKRATFQLGRDFSKYRPIKPKNPDDELGAFTKYFNETIKILKEKIISKSYLDNIINSISQSLIVIDNEKKIEKINYNTQELLGYSEGELIGKPIDSILAATNTLKIDELIKLDDFHDNCFSIDLLTKENNRKAVKIYFSSLLDSEGKRKGTICLAIEIDRLDITELDLRKSKEKAKRNTKRANIISAAKDD